MRMMVRLREGEPAHCTLLVITPHTEMSFGGRDSPHTTQLVESCFETQVCLSPKLQGRDSPRLPIPLTSTARLMSPRPASVSIGLAEHTENLYSWLWFVTVKGYRLKEKRCIEQHLGEFTEWCFQLSFPGGVMDHTTFPNNIDGVSSTREAHPSLGVRAC